MATDEAQAQMDPGITDLQAVLTPIGAGRYLLYLIKMRTLFCHMSTLSL